MSKRTAIVYALLAAVLTGVLSWQAIEHKRSKETARTALVHRARDITGTVGLVIRSQRGWWGSVIQPRLESALQELVQSEDLNSVALFNAAGQVVVQAGEPIDFTVLGNLAAGQRWHDATVTVVNLVDLGAALPHDGESPLPTIVVPEPLRPGRGDRPPGPHPAEGRRPHSPERTQPGERPEGGRFAPDERFSPAGSIESSDEIASDERSPRGFRRESGRGRIWGRPPWMNEEEFHSLIEKQGLHGFVIVMSADAFQAGVRRDLWLRGMIASFAILSAFGLGFAWRNLEKSSDLRLRLVRASEMNTHLREMNLAAAGLAHETRNPLNIIRGLAQLISKEEKTGPEIRRKSEDITAEVDRVTSRLNEFLHYSRPREVRRTSVPLSSVITDVLRALESDLEDKQIDLQRQEEDLVIQADEPMLRQVLFNLLINAIQALPASGGRLAVCSGENKSAGPFLEIRDNGPGVPAEHRQEIFRPYFTTNHHGTGLGLAVVQQIVVAHGWEIECQENQPQGVSFRIKGLQLAQKI